MKIPIPSARTATQKMMIQGHGFLFFCLKFPVSSGRMGEYALGAGLSPIGSMGELGTGWLCFGRIVGFPHQGQNFASVLIISFPQYGQYISNSFITFFLMDLESMVSAVQE